nr:site-specific DNA-methyltransferase [Legionella pneumophila]HAU1943875.1 site-specific DNA-methyltransferase [Legionella pneumophila]
MRSKNIIQDNIEKIQALFPNCITESQNKNGNVKLAIDFDQLKQELSDAIVEGPQERYHLNWPGKREALLTANAPIAKTLRPCREESVNFDTTEHLFIEGDNLEVLKLLQETYLGTVDVLYIDPPYNTGNDFIYDDDFKSKTEEYLLASSQTDSLKNRLIANNETNGRFHSDWLSMMYPRLKLARNLLAEDGVIFISMDDNEIHNLWNICEEIFGEDNFVANFIWEKRTNRENRKEVSYRHDNMLCFTKSRVANKALNQLPMNEKALANYKNPDNDPRGPWKSDPATAQSGHGTKGQFYELTAPNGQIHKLESGRCWLYTAEVMQEAINDNRIWFGKDGNGVPRIKTYLNAKERGLTPETILFAKDATTNEIAKTELKRLFGGLSAFDTPKPVKLIQILLQMTKKDALVMDFFAGSGATAHAVLNQNVEDGGRRKFILVQLDESCDQKSEAFKAGYQTIAEISKERIRRAGKLINEEKAGQVGVVNLDTGFRVLKVDSSNMNDVYYTTNTINQDLLSKHTDNVKSDRTPEDLLFQVLLDWGVDLTLPIKKSIIQEHDVFFVDEDALVACFDNDGKITEEFVKELTQYSPLRVIFRDAGFASDSVKINVTQIFKQLSPHTEVKTI